MDVEKAKSLRVGTYVLCPADRGDVAYTGKVTHVGQQVEKNIHDVPYIWVTVRHAKGHSTVWPSNRLS